MAEAPRDPGDAFAAMAQDIAAVLVVPHEKAVAMIRAAAEGEAHALARRFAGCYHADKCVLDTACSEYPSCNKIEETG